MRCLWITRQDPRPSNSGELIYTRGLLRALSAHPGFKVTVLAHRANGATEEPPDPKLRWELHGWIPKGRLGGLFSMLPSDSWRLGNFTMRDSLETLSEEGHWDWVIIDQAACGWVLKHLPEPGRPRIAYLAHNHEATVRKQVASERGGSLPFRAALSWDAWKYARLEQAICRRADLISAITPRDEALFKQEFPEKPTLCLPPGYNGPMVESPPLITKDSPRRVVLAGAFEWLAKRRNLELFLAAADAPFRQHNIRFVVAGKSDPDYFSALGRRYPWAEFHANVPSMDPYLSNARIGLIPEALGGGFKLKALDYIFRGLPVAALEQALSGLPVDASQDVITARQPAELAAAVAGKIDDLEFLNAAASRALFACRASFQWGDRGSALAAALEDLATSPPRP
ncbi:MAG: glycosyltransferase [Luteolibacter sp.]